MDNRGAFAHCCIAIIENSTEVPQNLKIELSYNPASPLLGTYPKEMKSIC
jgi:hypothetical protein